MNKKIICLAFIFTLSLTIFSGCNSKNDQISNSESTEITKANDSDQVANENVVQFNYDRTMNLIKYSDWLKYIDSDYINDYNIIGMASALSPDLKVDSDTQNEVSFYLQSSGNLKTSNLFDETQLKEGRSLTSNESKGECIITKNLADANQKKIGDTVVFTNPADESISKEFKIAGLVDLGSEDYNTTVQVSMADLDDFIGDTVDNGGFIATQFILNSEDDFNKLYDELKSKGFPEDVILSNQGIPKEGNIVNKIEAFKAASLKDNSEVTQDIFKTNDLTMINVWGTFCSPCLAEMPHLEEINKKYSDKLAVVGICSDAIDVEGKVASDKVELANEIIQKTNVTYTNIIPDSSLYQNLILKITAVPTTLFVDSSGTILQTVTGARDETEWTKIIDNLTSTLD